MTPENRSKDGECVTCGYCGMDAPLGMEHVCEGNPQYRTIVVDPPWPYPEGFARGGTNHLINGRRRTRAEQGAVTRTALPYRSMTLEDIATLPIPDLAHADCRLFLWATNRYLPDALTMVSGWRFQYRQLLVWDKTPNIPPFGGSVAANAGEFLVVAIRGKVSRNGHWPTSIIRARKPRTEHSRKPDTFLDLVEAVSPPPYCELFARRNRLGWHTWGDEALEHVSLEAS